MPIYEYECRHCGHHFELKQGFHDKPQADCPECNKKARRVFHPSPIIFKGSGFYVTDHRTSSETTARKGESESGKGKPEFSKTAPEPAKGKPEPAKAKPETKKSAD